MNINFSQGNTMFDTHAYGYRTESIPKNMPDYVIVRVPIGTREKYLNASKMGDAWQSAGHPLEWDGEPGVLPFKTINQPYGSGRLTGEY